MQIKRLVVQHVRALEQAEFIFQPGMNLLVGVNGVGKSTVLDILRIMFSRALPRFTASQTKPLRFGANDITIGNDLLNIEMKFIAHGIPFICSMTQLTQKRKVRFSIKPDNKTILVPLMQADEQPIVLYFSTTRSVPSKTLTYGQSATQGQIAAFAGSLLARRLRLGEFADWWLAQEALKSESDGDLPKRRLDMMKRAVTCFLDSYTDIQAKQEEIVTTQKAITSGLISTSFSQTDRLELLKVYEPSESTTYLSAIDKQQTPNLPQRSQELRIQYIQQPKSELLLNQKNKMLNIYQLSDGERGMLALVFDLVKRLTQANPKMADPLQDGKAVVLIDELDLHLHPGWQRTIVDNLTRTFPNCQFIATTHSPLILGEVKPQGLTLIRKEGNEIIVEQGIQGYGLDASYILKHLMGTASRTPPAQAQIDRVEDALEEGELDVARIHLAELRKMIHGDDDEVMRLEASINNLEALADEMD